MTRRATLLLLVLLTYSPAVRVLTARAGAAPQGAGAPPTAETKSSAKSKRAPARKRTLTPAQREAAVRRAQRLKKAFVASAELRPMAQQLLENRSAAAYSGVENWARQHAGTDAAGLAWLVVGYAHYLDREFDRAIPALERAQPNAGELGDYVAYFLAQAQAASGEGEQALAVLQPFAAQWPESLYGREAAVLRANLLTTLDRPQEAIAALAPYRATFRAEIELTAGRAYRKAGDVPHAAAAWQRIYYAAPLSTQADDAAKELEAMAGDPSVPRPTLAERIQRAELLLTGRRYAEAAKDYRGLLAGAEPPNRNELELHLGIATYRSGNRAEARRVLESLPAATDEASAQRLYYLGEIARFDGDDERFRRQLEQFRQEFPNSAWLEESLLSAANMYLLRRDYETAVKYYREIYERLPFGKHAAYAHWKVAWLRLRQGQDGEARQLFEEQVRRYPGSAETPPSLYWGARLAEEAQDVGRARAWYTRLAQRFRSYYYADLARERLRALQAEDVPDDPTLDGLGNAPAPHYVDAAPPGDDVRLQKSRLLRNGALFEFAVRELEAASAAGEAAWATSEMTRVYQEAGRYRSRTATDEAHHPVVFPGGIERAAAPVLGSLVPARLLGRPETVCGRKRPRSLPGGVAHPSGIGIQPAGHLARQCLGTDAAAAVGREAAGPRSEAAHSYQRAVAGAGDESAAGHPPLQGATGKIRRQCGVRAGRLQCRPRARGGMAQ